MPIGPTGLDVEIRHVAFGPDGTLYGIDRDLQRLVTLDPGTGQATVVGPFDDPGPIEFLGLAADACGRLWATGFELVDGPGSAAEYWLVGIDPVTGHLERLATGDSYQIFSLAARGETLYGQGTAGLLLIDPHDLSVHEIGGASEGVPQGLAFAADGTLWGTSIEPLLPGNLDHFAYTIDPESGERTVVTVGAVPSSDFAIMPPTGRCLGVSPLEVPAAGPTGLAVLALLLALGAMVTLRRQGVAMQPPPRP